MSFIMIAATNINPNPSAFRFGPTFDLHNKSLLTELKNPLAKCLFLLFEVPYPIIHEAKNT